MSNKAIVGRFKAQQSDKGIVIEGWANKAIVDRGGDIIPKSAWELTNFEKNPIILFNHDKSQPIGRALITEARDEGLYVKARISQSDSPDIAKVRDLIKEGVVNAFSVGFDMKAAEKNADGYNEIKSAELFEISVVAIPMNQDSIFSMQKTLDYDELKTICKAQDEASDDDKPMAQESQAEAQGEGDKEPDSSDSPEESDKDTKALSAELELEVQAVCVTKESYTELDLAKEAVAAAGWSVETVEEQENAWHFIQAPEDSFSGLMEGFDAGFGEGSYLKFGLMAEAPEEDVEIEVEDGKEKSATVPMPADNPQVPESEQVAQAKQTNILLGVAITELQKLGDAIVQLATAMPPKQAPEPVKVEEPKQLDDDVAQDTEVVREYLASIKKTLDRIGA